MRCRKGVNGLPLRPTLGTFSARLHLLSPLCGKDVKKAKEMSVNLAVGRHYAWWNGISHHCVQVAMGIALVLDLVNERLVVPLQGTSAHRVTVAGCVMLQSRIGCLPSSDKFMKAPYTLLVVR
jgi:hypothetical protein